MELQQGGPHRGVVVEVWEDLVCPWCYLGRHRLYAAVQSFEHPHEVTIRSQAYELAPNLPCGIGQSVPEWLASWGLTEAQVTRKLTAAQEAAEAAGLALDMGRAVAANTFDGHRLVELAWQTGGSPLQSAVIERLFSAHFCEGLALDAPDVLIRLGAEAGLEPSALPAFLAGDELAEQVRAAQATARGFGITAVPCFVADRRIAVSGAESVDVLLALLRRAHQDASLAMTDVEAP